MILSRLQCWLNGYHDMALVEITLFVRQTWRCRRCGKLVTGPHLGGLQYLYNPHLIEKQLIDLDVL